MKYFVAAKRAEAEALKSQERAAKNAEKVREQAEARAESRAKVDAERAAKAEARRVQDVAEKEAKRAQRELKRAAEEAEEVPEIDLYRPDEPTPQELSNADHCIKAIALKLYQRVGICPEKYRLLDKLDFGPLSPDEVEQLRQAILSEALTPADLKRILAEWHSGTNGLSVQRKLFACGTCGIRTIGAPPRFFPLDYYNHMRLTDHELRSYYALGEYVCM